MRLQTGKAINALLSANEEVTRMVGDRIYPLVSKVDCKFPFIVYQRMSCLPTYTKDGLIAEKQNYSITVLADTYSDSVELADAVRDALELERGTFSGQYIRNIKLTSVNESWVSDTYVQELNFTIEL